MRESKEEFELRLKSTRRLGQRLRVVEVRYAPTPDADARLSRAIDILLGTSEPKGADHEHLDSHTGNEHK